MDTPPSRIPPVAGQAGRIVQSGHKCAPLFLAGLASRAQVHSNSREAGRAHVITMKTASRKHESEGGQVRMTDGQTPDDDQTTKSCAEPDQNEFFSRGCCAENTQRSDNGPTASTHTHTHTRSRLKQVENWNLERTSAAGSARKRGVACMCQQGSPGCTSACRDNSTRDQCLSFNDWSQACDAALFVDVRYSAHSRVVRTLLSNSRCQPRFQRDCRVARVSPPRRSGRG